MSGAGPISARRFESCLLWLERPQRCPIKPSGATHIHCRDRVQPPTQASRLRCSAASLHRLQVRPRAGRARRSAQGPCLPQAGGASRSSPMDSAQKRGVGLVRSPLGAGLHSVLGCTRGVLLGWRPRVWSGRRFLSERAASSAGADGWARRGRRAGWGAGDTTARAFARARRGRAPWREGACAHHAGPPAPVGVASARPGGPCFLNGAGAGPAALGRGQCLASCRAPRGRL